MKAATLLKFIIFQVLVLPSFIHLIGGRVISLSMNQLFITVILAIMGGLLGFSLLTAHFVRSHD